MYKKESDYTEIYRGELSSYRVTNLESGLDYRARVCAIRMTNEGLLLNSPYSAATHFVLPRVGDLAASLPPTKTTDHRSTNADRRESHGSLISRSCSSIYRKLESMKLFESRTLTDQQWAFVISVGFALLAIFIAIFANVIYSKYNNHRSVDNTISPSSPSPGFPHSQWEDFQEEWLVFCLSSCFFFSLHISILVFLSMGSFFSSVCLLFFCTVKCYRLIFGYRWWWWQWRRKKNENWLTCAWALLTRVYQLNI